MADSSPGADLEAYAARYRGRGRIFRLRFVALHKKELELDALRMAVDTAKEGKDTMLYKELCAQAADRLGPEYELDTEWVLKIDKEAAVELERLRRELEDHRQQHNKEVIRAGHSDLGDYFYSRGKMTQARGEYVIMRDYCMRTSHLMAMWTKVVLVSVEAGDFEHVESFVHTAESIPETESMRMELSKMQFSACLALMVRGRYKDAALRFLHTPLDLSEDKSTQLHSLFSDTFSIEDVALYAGICALATMSRSSLMEHLTGNSEYRALLELGPNIYPLITDFCATKYASCLARFEKLRPDLMLDPYLGRDDHVNKLYGMIRSKALVQYVYPFESVDLTRMAATFDTSVELLRQELIGLIESKSINARIDMQKNSLHRKGQNLRKTALKRALATGETAFNDAEAMLLRMRLTKSGMSISWPTCGPRTESTMENRALSTNSVTENV